VQTGSVGPRSGKSTCFALYCSEKLTQYLTPEEGKIRLRETKAIMRISQDKKDFWTKMDVAYPKLNDDNVLLPFSELPRLEKPK
jgi:hypothetical protein